MFGKKRSKIRQKTLNVPEATEQEALVTWVRGLGIRISGSANGGKRTVYTGAKLKRMGMSPGFPDIEIPLPAGRYHGLYIEMKRKDGGTLTHEQADWLNYLNGEGYCAQVAHGFDEAKQIVLRYLQNRATNG